MAAYAPMYCSLFQFNPCSNHVIDRLLTVWLANLVPNPLRKGKQIKHSLQEDRRQLTDDKDEIAKVLNVFIKGLCALNIIMKAFSNVIKNI